MANGSWLIGPMNNVRITQMRGATRSIRHSSGSFAVYLTLMSCSLFSNVLSHWPGLSLSILTATLYDNKDRLNTVYDYSLSSCCFLNVWTRLYTRKVDTCQMETETGSMQHIMIHISKHNMYFWNRFYVFYVCISTLALTVPPPPFFKH